MWKRESNWNGAMWILLMSLVCAELVEGTEEYDRVTREIQNDLDAIQASISAAAKGLEDAMAEYGMKKGKEVADSTDYNSLQMYEWYEKEGTNAAKKCLSSQRNLQMIRTGHKEHVSQCLARADGCFARIKEQVDALNKLMDKYKDTAELTAPCHQLDNQAECLSQAVDLAKSRTESISAVVQRFEIFKKLKLFEVETNYQVCKSISQIYKESEKTEIDLLIKCMSGAADSRKTTAADALA